MKKREKRMKQNQTEQSRMRQSPIEKGRIKQKFRDKTKARIAAFVISVVMVSTSIGGVTPFLITFNPYAEASGGSESENGAENQTEMDNVSETESEGLTGSETEIETEMESESETVFKFETESEIIETESESGNETETESETETETETETELETETETEIETESETETETETETESETETETEIETESEAETESETEMETESELQTEHVKPSETEPPMSETQTTGEPTTETPTTEAPTAEAPTTEAPTTEAPTTETPTTETPTTEAPATGTPETETPAPAPIVRGSDYDLTGDSGAWYRDTDDRLWVRQGSSLTAAPKKGSGYNLGSSVTDVQKDGELSVSLKKVNADGTVVKESAVQQEAYYVDGEAPQAGFQITGSQSGEVVYSSGSCAVSVSVAADGKSGLKNTYYKIVSSDLNGSVSEPAASGTWKECSSTATIQVSGEGIYRVYIKTEDMVGNTAFSGSKVICVDDSLPEIQITGVGDQTANSGSVKLRVTCTDSYYKSDSLKVSIHGVNQGHSPTVSGKGQDGSGAWVEYQDFPAAQEYDDVYEVTVTAEDIAGNKQEKTVRFSINRFGSVYDLSSETQTMLNEYFLSEAETVVFYETNIDYVGESKIYCRFDGVLTELSAGIDYQVSMEGSDDSWKRYCYTIPAEYFTKEGVYELQLVSGDAASNASDTSIQNKQVTFVLDHTAPTCTISGIRENGVYEEKTKTFCVIPDDNIGLECVRIYHNSELLLENAGQPESGEAIKLTLVENEEWQTVQIWLCDKAGNEYWSEELPVFVGAEDVNVPTYQKLRPSAMELSQIESSDSGAYEELMAAYAALADTTSETDSGADVESLSYSSTAEEAAKENSVKTDKEGEGRNAAADEASETAEKSGIGTRFSELFKTTSEGGIFQTNERSGVTGWILLGIGVIIFAVTIVCSRTGLFGKDHV